MHLSSSSAADLRGFAPTSSEVSSPLSAIILAAAGMVTRWRGQVRSTIQIVRASRAKLRAEAARREAAQRRQQCGKKPPASLARSALYMQALALENAALAFDAEAAGDLGMAAHHRAEAVWFAAEARQRAAFTAIWPEV